MTVKIELTYYANETQSKKTFEGKTWIEARVAEYEYMNKIPLYTILERRIIDEKTDTKRD